MTYKTFEQWKDKGRYVIEGEKAVGKLNDGTTLFSKEQTSKANINVSDSRVIHQYQYAGTNWEQSQDWDYLHEEGIEIGLNGH